MKAHPSHALRGFTLVELLVVIAIIAVLAGLATSMASSMIQKAKKTTCLATATAIETAVNNFYTEYASMPSSGTADTTAAAPLKTDATTGLNLLRVLLGIESSTASPIYNSRGIKFLSVKEGKANKNGLIYNTAGTDITGMFDPWGGSYNIILDLDYNEKISAKTKAETAAVTLNGRRVAVWSDGADGVSATGKATDDVKTWGQ
jgi:prepilin-type N-terminal cleavage/methylation domain-containing protein